MCVFVYVRVKSIYWQKRNTDRVEEDSNEEIDNDDSGDDKELYGCDIDDDVSVTDSFLEALKLDLPLDDLVQLSYGK